MDCVSEREKRKYEKLAALESYQNSIGLRFVGRAMNKLGIQSGDSLIDFGCGTGRAMSEFRDLGVQVTGVDLTPARMKPDLPFVRASLWDLPVALKPADWGFCTDVMEHLPEDKVAESLLQIRSKVRRGLFFAISTRPDRKGALIGEVLHLTVWPAKSWKLVLERFWTVTDFRASETRLRCCCFPKSY